MKKVENELYGQLILDPKKRRMFTVDYLTGKADREICDTVTITEVFDALKSELSRVFGNYDWSLEGNNRDGWMILAYYTLHGKLKSFTESKGASAWSAFWNCDKIRAILN